MADLEIVCNCGQLKAVIRETGPDQGERLICYCRDCQAAAHHLAHPETLDQWGGTDLFITTPARLEIIEGAQFLACFSFSPNAPRRWHASCCNTHIGNSLKNPAAPFMALNLACTSPNSRQLVGTATRGLFVRDAHGSPAVGRQHTGVSRAAGMKILMRILLATVRRQAGKSPFMKDGQPVSDTKIVNREARAAALASAGFS